MGYFGVCDICKVANDCRYKDGKMLCGDCEIDWDQEFGDDGDDDPCPDTGDLFK